MFDFEEKLLHEIPIVVLDTETTGLLPKMGHRIVEIGAVRFEQWQVVGEMNQLIQPGRKMDPGASAVNGIYDEDLVGKPTFAELIDELLSLTADALMVAHNAVFDAGFLSMEFYICGHQDRSGRAALHLPNPWLCTLELARCNFHFGSNSLAHVARTLGVRIGRAHRALNDVYTTAEILKRMTRDLRRWQSVRVGDLFHAQGGPIYALPTQEVTLPDPIRGALLDKRPLRIRYAGSTGESERTITPIYPTQYRGFTYLVAYCHLRKDQRTFRLDRIIETISISDQ